MNRKEKAKTEEPLLEWKPILNGRHFEAELGTKEDGVNFCLSYYSTCYRRGQWRLLIEVYEGANHHKWGCFDQQDQPTRWYHSEVNARSEAELIAQVLLTDRLKEVVNTGGSKEPCLTEKGI